MRKLLIILPCIISVVIMSLTCLLVYVEDMPEYALLKIAVQTKEEGFDAIERNLTDEAYTRIEPIIKFAKNDIVQSVIGYVKDSEYFASIFVNRAGEIKWSVGEIKKSKRRATVTIGFNYDDRFIGTIDLEVVKEFGEWKINDLKNLTVDKFDV